MDNHAFNLMNQLVQEQKSLWRIEGHYIPEATKKAELSFWKKLRTQKKKNIADLKKICKTYLK